MAFQVPTFNIRCNIWNVQIDWSIGAPAGAPTQANVPCNLQFGRKEAVGGNLTMWLLLPAGTNINGEGSYALTPTLFVADGDGVEVPAGSGRFYAVVMVDDVSLGFPTEYRAALIQDGGTKSLQEGGPYLNPIPWPH